MKIFLAGTGQLKNSPELLKNSDYFLESFLSIKDWQMPYFLNAKDFLLDSGAYTFIINAGKMKFDLNDFVKKYAAFINKYDIKHYFEMDFDNILGYEKVIEVRNELEHLTQKPSIPVWHISRGKEEFLKMCEDYDYVALGDIAASKNLHLPYHHEYVKMLPWFINEAHKRKCKIHGLGFTQTTKFKQCPFDTVDSTTWVNGGRFGGIFRMSTDRMHEKHFSDKRVYNLNGLTKHNFLEWCKFQKYAERNL